MTGAPAPTAPPAPEKTDLWMPMWIGDYLADTMDLARDLHGGYLLLLMAYWRNRGPLADDPERLLSIMKASPDEWPRLKARLLDEFFTPSDGSWSHKRADAELLKASLNKSRAAAGGAGRWGETDGARGRDLRASRLAAARQRGIHTDAQWALLCHFHGGACPRCGQPARKFCKDHIVPVYQDGSSDAIDNLQPLCKSCSSGKGPERVDHRRPGWRDFLVDNGAFDASPAGGEPALMPARMPASTPACSLLVACPSPSPSPVETLTGFNSVAKATAGEPAAQPPGDCGPVGKPVNSPAAPAAPAAPPTPPTPPPPPPAAPPRPPRKPSARAPLEGLPAAARGVKYIELSAEEIRRREVWRGARRVLATFVPEKRIGNVCGKLVADFGFEAFAEAVTAATQTATGNPIEYLTATCQRVVGERVSRTPSKQAALEASNDKVLAEWLAAHPTVPETIDEEK